MSQFRRLQRQLEVPQRKSQGNGHVSLAAGNGDRSGISSGRNIAGAPRDIEINPKGLVLARGYSGRNSSKAPAQRCTRFRVNEWYQRLGIGSCAQRLVASSYVVTTLNRHIILAVETQSPSRGGRTRWAKK